MNIRVISYKMMFVAVVAAGIFICAVPMGASAAGATVRSVEFQGNKRTPAETIRATISTAEGRPLDQVQIDKDIKALFKLGQFSDIRVDSDGSKVTFIFVESPLISEIAFKGNKKIKSKDLNEHVSQRTFTALNEKDIADTKEKIKGAYAKKGYYLVDIDYHVTTNDDGQQTLVFDIKENQGVSIRKILFIGNEKYSDDDLRKLIKTRKKGMFSFVSNSGKFDEPELGNDVKRLMFQYLNNGYLKVKVAPPKVTISKDKKYIFVTFQIHEGKQYKLGNISMSGDILTTNEELMNALKLKSGKIYSQQLMEEDLTGLTERYGDEGYSYANIYPRITPDDETLTADVDININKGSRIKIDRINIGGNKTTRDKVIRRELELKENDRYSERLIKKSRMKLMQLGYFEEVNFATPRGSLEDSVDLNIDVKEKSTGSFNIGAGFSSVDQFILTASVQKQNFFGYGVGGSLSTQISKKGQLFMLSLQDPYFLDTEWMAGFSAYKNGYSYNDFRRDSEGGDINLGHRFFDNFSARVGYQIENVRVSEFSFAVPQFLKINSSGLTSALSFTVDRDTRDNRIMPTKGTYNTVTQEISGTKLGGDNDFYRVNYRSMFYQPVWKGITFKQFFRTGYIKSLNDSQVPLFERFFAGGVDSLRGFFPNSVGPRLRIPQTTFGRDAEFVYGGDKLMIFVSELELPVVKKAGISIVGFFDAGNAYAEEQNYSLQNMRMDYGVGIRWNSPMGPLRFEWGFPIDRRAGEDSMVLNFTIGSFF